MKRFILLVVYSLVAFLASNSQTPDAEGSLVKWMSVKEAMEKNATQPRPILLDFYTSWCGWCKHMMRTTYANPDLAGYINANFYPVKFDAEGKDTIVYLGETYRPTSMEPRTPHPLAIKLLQGKLVYPTTLFLNGFDKQKNEFALNMLAQGALDEKKIQPMLIFTLENVFRNASFDEFHEQYEKTFFDPANEIQHKEVNWLKPEEHFTTEAKDSSDKKMLILIQTDWCNSCRVMQRSSFSDPATLKYLKEKYYLVDFNPQKQTKLHFKGQEYTFNPAAPFHPLAIALGRNAITLPSVIFLDEKGNTLDVIPFYLLPGSLLQIARYYGDDIFRTKSWKDFTTVK